MAEATKISLSKGDTLVIRAPVGWGLCNCQDFAKWIKEGEFFPDDVKVLVVPDTNLDFLVVAAANLHESPETPEEGIHTRIKWDR